MAIESDESEIMFIELPVMNMYTKATSSDMGIVRMIMRVARHLPRKKQHYQYHEESCVHQCLRKVID